MRELNREQRIRRMRRCVLAAGEACKAIRGVRSNCVMVTLTYRQDVEWKSGQMSQFMMRVRKHLERRGVAVRYQWVLELTKRGRCHYHCLFWLPWSERLPKPDDEGWWPHGMTQIQRARNAVGYLVKYVSKGDQEASFPKGARLFGTAAPEGDVKLAVRRARMPAWLRSEADPLSVWIKRPRSGWVDIATGECRKSPYVVTFDRDDETGLWTITVERTTPGGTLQ